MWGGWGGTSDGQSGGIAGGILPPPFPSALVRCKMAVLTTASFLPEICKRGTLFLPSSKSLLSVLCNGKSPS